MEKYYIICLEQKSNEGTLLFWRPGSAGYTSSLDEAGLFNDERANNINKGGRDIALTREQLSKISKIYTVADCPLDELLDKKEGFNAILKGNLRMENKKKNNWSDKKKRVEKVNQLIECIGNCGRKFFFHAKRYSQFFWEENKRIWYMDKYSCKRIYMHNPGNWSGFTEGGTLRELVKALFEYIKTGNKIHPYHFGPWKKSLCEGDLWGYKEDMQNVRDKAKELEII